jgi:hypothetical protein
VSCVASSTPVSTSHITRRCASGSTPPAEPESS